MRCRSFPACELVVRRFHWHLSVLSSTLLPAFTGCPRWSQFTVCLPTPPGDCAVTGCPAPESGSLESRPARNS